MQVKFPLALVTQGALPLVTVYNKIFTRILDSSIWLETNTTRIVWITFLASMDETGYAHFAALANLAKRAGVTLEEAEAAVKVLEAPDRESSDPANDGRRIERIPGGWMVLNAEKYRLLVSRAIIQEQTRIRVAKFRERKRGNAPVTHGSVSGNADVTPSEASAGSEAKQKEKQGAVAPPASDSEWLASLCTSTAYQGIDVRREFEKMNLWACTNKKQATKRRFINWLNRVERPLSVSNGAAAPQKPSLNEPRGWKAWLNHNLPDSAFSTGGVHECHEWSKLPRHGQEAVLQGMARQG